MAEQPQPEEQQQGQSYECLVAQTALVLPFHWGDLPAAHNDHDEPAEGIRLARYLLMDKLLQRFVVHPDTGQREFLWDINRTVPFELAELSAYLKHILGWDDTVKYYRANRSAKEQAFGLGRRGADDSSDSDSDDDDANVAATTRGWRPAAAATSNGNNGHGDEEEMVEEVVGGEDTKGFEDMEVWKCQRLVMNDSVRRMVFPHVSLWAHPHADRISIESSSNTLGGDPHDPLAGEGNPVLDGDDGEEEEEGEETDRECCQVAVTKVELILYPLGNGLLLFHVDWRPDPMQRLTLDRLRTWLFMAKFKHKVRGVFHGWALGQQEEEQGEEDEKGNVEGSTLAAPHFGPHADSLGKLARALYGGGRVSLSCIGNWLVHLPHENSLHPPRRISYSAYAHHHSVVVIDRQPTKRDLREYLHHLTRASNVDSMTPDVLLPEAMHHGRRGCRGGGGGSGLEQILPHRRNRYLGLSVEGNVAFSWLGQGARPRFECVTWPRVYQGVYLLLDLHTRGESSVLSELSRMSARVAEHLHLTSFDELERDRLRLRAVAMQMIKYSLGLSSDACSGMSEYAEYFTTSRRVLGIASAKQKIREEIEHVLSIVESVHLEAQRRLRRAEKRESRRREQARRRAEARKEARRQRFEALISLTGTVTLPLVLVGGLMGMNLHDLPEVGFWPLMGYTALASLSLFVLLLLWYAKVFPYVWRCLLGRRRCNGGADDRDEAEVEEVDEEEEGDDEPGMSLTTKSRLNLFDEPTPSRPRHLFFRSKRNNLPAEDSSTTPLLFRG